ncbi:MAG: hypothetical protein LUD47_00195 [Clostridia bacterium]|nr:hypothetical protein [Clostridia bacterium]
MKSAEVFGSEKTDEETYEYDRMDVTIRSSVADTLVDCYTALGWEIVERGTDGEAVHCSMRRPHDISKRDHRQYLQVRVESKANEAAKILRHGHRASAIISAVLGAVSLAILALGILAMVYASAAIDYVLGAVCVLAAAAIAALSVRLCVRVARRESLRIRERLSECSKELTALYCIIRTTFAEGGEVEDAV